MTQPPTAAYMLSRENFDRIYGPDQRQRIASLLHLPHEQVIPPQGAADHAAFLNDVEIVLSGWGGPTLDQAMLDRLPNLKIMFYAAGTIKTIATDAMWRRGVRICSAWAANAVPVAEFCLAQIILAGKQTLSYYRMDHDIFATKHARDAYLGFYEKKVGLIALGQIGRMVARMLQPFNVEVLAYDPFIEPADAEALGVKPVTLEQIFEQCDIVSLHMPWLKETEKTITAEHFRAMKPHATFMNTARGAIVDEAGMIEVLRERDDLMAILDVTWPEPPAEDSPLWSLPNVFLTPHIAGSMGVECHRMADYMIEEIERYLAGRPLQWEVSEAQFAHMA